MRAFVQIRDPEIPIILRFHQLTEDKYNIHLIAYDILKFISKYHLHNWIYVDIVGRQEMD